MRIELLILLGRTGAAHMHCEKPDAGPEQVGLRRLYSGTMTIVAEPMTKRGSWCGVLLIRGDHEADMDAVVHLVGVQARESRPAKASRDRPIFMSMALAPS